MPTRHFWVDTKNPTWKQKAKAHPMELVYAAMSFVFGVMLVFSEFSIEYYPSPPVKNLNAWQGFLMGGSLFVGAIFMVVGLLAKLPDLEAEYLFERVGLSLCCLSWLTYACAVYIWDPEYGGALVLGVGMACMGLSRLYITFLIRRDFSKLSRRHR